MSWVCLTGVLGSHYYPGEASLQGPLGVKYSKITTLYIFSLTAKTIHCFFFLEELHANFH